MARLPSKTLTEREAQIMEVLWGRARATAEQIRETMPGEPHDSTVRTLLRILEKKGYVKHSVRGKSYVYRATIAKPKAQDKAITHLLKQFFGGSAEALVLRLIDDEQILPEQLDELRSRHRASRP
ncbi:MAG: CopY family transcriptional regulator [Phycisphaeraceae bacterium]|nr:CopY family transcriptional regulator [Phycisphaeraceae bacterium]